MSRHWIEQFKKLLNPLFSVPNKSNCERVFFSRFQKLEKDWKKEVNKRKTWRMKYEVLWNTVDWLAGWHKENRWNLSIYSVPFPNIWYIRTPWINGVSAKSRIKFDLIDFNVIYADVIVVMTVWCWQKRIEKNVSVKM